MRIMPDRQISPKFGDAVFLLSEISDSKKIKKLPSIGQGILMKFWKKIRSIMFSILKKIFAHISGKAEKQAFREKERQISDIYDKKFEKQKSCRKNGQDQKNPDKEMRKSAEHKQPVPVQQIQENRTSRPVSSGKKNRKRSAKALNRLGIPVYEKHTDFSKYFAEETEKQEKSFPVKKAGQTESPAPVKQVREKTGKDSQTEMPVSEKTGRVRKKKQVCAKSNVCFPGSVPRNRHGIPLFKETDDLARYFREEHSGEMYRQSPERTDPFPHQSNKANEAADDFQKLLHQSLAEHGKEDMLKKKFEGHAPVPPKPLRKKIAEYPPPQEVMDLHGCTADQAEEKTEAFIRRARHKGMRTLLIIVGKGLHSDGKAVLPDVVENRILVLKQKNWVLSYEWEKKIQRKSGALIVYLTDVN